MKTTLSDRRDSKRLVDAYRAQAARRLSQDALRGAGTLRQTGEAMTPPRAEGTVGNYVTRTDCPELRGLFRILVGLEPWNEGKVAEGLRVFRDLNTSPEVTARALVEALDEAVLVGELVEADPRILVDRLRYLMGERHRWNMEETAAVERGDLEAFRRAATLEAEGQHEADRIIDVLQELHGADIIRVLRGEAS